MSHEEGVPTSEVLSVKDIVTIVQETKESEIDDESEELIVVEVIKPKMTIKELTASLDVARECFLQADDLVAENFEMIDKLKFKAINVSEALKKHSKILF